MTTAPPPTSNAFMVVSDGYDVIALKPASIKVGDTIIGYSSVNGNWKHPFEGYDGLRTDLPITAIDIHGAYTNKPDIVAWMLKQPWYLVRRPKPAPPGGASLAYVKPMTVPLGSVFYFDYRYETKSATLELTGDQVKVGDIVTDFRLSKNLSWVKLDASRLFPIARIEDRCCYLNEVGEGKCPVLRLSPHNIFRVIRAIGEAPKPERHVEINVPPEQATPLMDKLRKEFEDQKRRILTLEKLEAGAAKIGAQSFADGSNETGECRAQGLRRDDFAAYVIASACWSITLRRKQAEAREQERKDAMIYVDPYYEEWE